MALPEHDIDRLAARLDEALARASPIEKLTNEHKELSLEEAYRIQRAGIALRKIRGEVLIGMKMGLTSRAKMEQMGVSEPIYGHLTSSMRLSDGGVLEHARHCHPRVEPEVAFLLGRDLEGPVTPAEALLAVDGVSAALEVIDSRYQNFQFTLPDVVADNASSARFVLGSIVKRPGAVDLGNLGMVMEVNGAVVEIGSSAAILEHPARSLACLAGLLALVGEKLKAGQIVLAGGATKAVALSPQDRVRVRVQDLGAAGFRVA